MILAHIATFDDPHIAHIARSRLESEGIRARLDGEYHVAMDWMITNAVGGVKLLVHESDREAALTALRESSGEVDDSETGDETTDDSPVYPCPLCGSTETFRMRLNRKWIFISMLFLGVPIPILSRRIGCESCHHRFLHRHFGT